ncbi:hypothetical protein [Halobacillus sp. A5]|uniref:hypothetical protein n=1 Tax=Halobacillus sp. A5 TaxID=2880263 RepID=UPI0020A6979D|nr:hypothetical protein [Halobacillus sp. A5]MCP3027016.1 hypothetical protein [Halobacillus sp. A5]
MDIEIAEMSRMSERGSSLLRLIQNTETPVLDLLVRESIQNSLDAADSSGCPIKFDILVNKFNKKCVSQHFSGIENSLEEKFSGIEQSSLIVRDWNTTGLTGPIHHDYIKNDEYGNLLKLVYEISMPQSKKDAGGSWGLGKTVYYRIGAGLVVYYSRVKKENGQYESRLAACLVEDESKEDTLLPVNINSPKRGIAWWGVKHTSNSTMPLTNEAEIKNILRDFDVSPYAEDETGTTVIIPFINPKDLIPQEENNQNLWWHSSIEYYLQIAIQRWYSPRIDNWSFPYGKPLNPSVNGELIRGEHMEPLFSIIRELYIQATSHVSLPSRYIYQKDILKKDIILYRDLSNNVAGHVVFTKVDKDQLRMTVPYNKKSPFQFLEYNDEYSDNNHPIITFTRKPGLVINYETVGKWVRGIQKTENDKYIIGIFVPDSDNIMKSAENITLEEYLRKSEKADHTSWSDLTINNKKFTITDRIQKKVASSISEAYRENEQTTSRNKSGALSKALATHLLPPAGFGSQPGVVPENHKKTKKGMEKTFPKDSFNIINVYRTATGEMQVGFEINISNRTNHFLLEPEIEAEGNKKIAGDQWERENVIGTKFPVEINDVNIKDCEGLELLKLDFSYTKRFEVKNKILLHLNGNSGKIKGSLTLSSYDTSLQVSINYISESFKGIK